MPNYAPRISLPYNDVSGVINLWADSCDKVAVFEHPADQKVKTTHVHLILINCKYKTPEALKRIFHKNVCLVDNEITNGNGLWKWTSKYGEPDETFIKYMSKGKRYAPKFLKNISPDEVEELASKWVEPSSDHAKKVPKAEELHKTHWEICQEIIQELNKLPKDRINPVTISLTGQYDFRTLYRITMVVLKKYHVRTSRNELERFLVTIMRDDVNFEEDVMSSIQRNIFRT